MAFASGKRVPLVSVVKPTRNRYAVLHDSLLSLCHQTLPPSEFEVIVVDDGSVDSTAARLQCVSLPYRLIIIRQSNQGLASARNTGILRASGEIVCFLDDDILAHPRLLEEHLFSHQADPNLVVIGALPYPPHQQATPLLWYLRKIGHYDLYQKWHSQGEGSAVVNGNSSVRRKHLLRVGMYDTDFRGYGGEDRELGYRLQRAGLHFEYNRRAIGYHYCVKVFQEFCNEMESSGKAIVTMYYKHPEAREELNIDILTNSWRTLRPSKVIRKLAVNALFHYPAMVEMMKKLIGWLEHWKARWSLYILYYIVSHYFYARGMRSALECYHPDDLGGHIPPASNQATLIEAEGMHRVGCQD